MVVPVDLPSVKPHSQCFVKRVSSSLKLRQRKQLCFPASASLTDTKFTACTPSTGSQSSHQQIHHNTSALRVPMTSMQIRHAIRWTSSFTPPYIIWILHFRSFTGMTTCSGKKLMQTNKQKSHEVTCQNRWLPERGLFLTQECQPPDVTRLLWQTMRIMLLNAAAYGMHPHRWAWKHTRLPP